MTEQIEPPAAALVLADLPAGETVAWHCDQITPDHPYAADWVAINIDLAEAGDDPPPWTLTLDPPGAEVDDPVAGFGWPPDLAIHRVVEARPIVPRTVAEAVTATGRQPDPDESARLRSALTGPARTMTVLPAWSTDAVTAGLNDWAARVLLRPDLRFHWDGGVGISPLGAWVEEQTRLAATGPQYESGIPGVTLSEVMMDSLLAMGPDGAAEVMDFVRGIADDTC